MHVVRWFLDVHDLFRFNGLECLGLDLVQVHADAKLRRFTFSKADYLGLRIMGGAYTSAFNEKRAEQMANQPRPGR